MNIVGFKAPLLISPKRTHVYASGVLLDTEYAGRYLKVSPANSSFVTDAVAVGDFLDTHGIGVKQIIDVGANVGEYSLYFTRRYPDVSILAVEP
jgi:tRNA1(Val) A37 N6-methylase TrmN6